MVPRWVLGLVRAPQLCLTCTHSLLSCTMDGGQGLSQTPRGCLAILVVGLDDVHLKGQHTQDISVGLISRLLCI